MKVKDCLLIKSPSDIFMCARCLRQKRCASMCAGTQRHHSSKGKLHILAVLLTSDLGRFCDEILTFFGMEHEPKRGMEMLTLQSYIQRSEPRSTQQGNRHLS